MPGVLRLWPLVGVGWLVAVSPVAASGQAPVHVAGIVRDDTGAVIKGVEVRISGAALTAPRTAVTDDQGKYDFPDLAPGRYTIDAVAVGFEPHTADLVVESAPASHDIVLRVSSYLERVTVTATKTGETDVQQTPIAITALPGRTLQKLGVNTVAGMTGFVPSMTVEQQTALVQVTIRGIGSNTSISGADPSCTIHLDGVYLGRPATALFDFLDVDRVEVLRGPVEASGAARGWQLAGHFSWIDAKYDRYLADGTGGITGDAAGHQLNNSPEWSGSGSAAYEFATGGAGFASVRSDVVWQSRVFFTAFNDNIETQGKYGLVQLRGGFEPRSRRWEIALYARNLANTPYITSTANIFMNPAITARPGESRQWGTQFTLHP